MVEHERILSREVQTGQIIVPIDPEDYLDEEKAKETPILILPDDAEKVILPVEGPKFQTTEFFPKPKVAWFNPPHSPDEKIEIEGVGQITGDDLLKAVLKYLTDPSHVVAVTGHKGSGKSHVVAYIIWFCANIHKIIPGHPGKIVLTNMIFKQKQADGSWKKAYPPNVRYVNNFYDVLRMTAEILRNTEKEVVVVWDELQNFMSAYNWSENLAKQIVLYFGILRKFKQSYVLSLPDQKLMPAGIRDWNRDVLTAHLYKDLAATGDLNFQQKTNYRVKDICFVEKKGFKVEYFEVGTCPWNMPADKVPIGGYIYDHLVSASMFLGGFEGYKFHFKHMNDYIEGIISEEIPDKLMEFFEKLEGVRSQIEGGATPEEAGAPERPKEEIRPTMSKGERSDWERAKLLKFLAVHTNLPKKALRGIGLATPFKTACKILEDYRMAYRQMHQEQDPREIEDFDTAQGFEWSDNEPELDGEIEAVELEEEIEEDEME